MKIGMKVVSAEIILILHIILIFCHPYYQRGVSANFRGEDGRNVGSGIIVC